MAEDKPIVKLDNFNINNIHLLRSLLPIKVGGKYILSEGYDSYNLYDSDEASSLENLTTKMGGMSPFHFATTEFGSRVYMIGMNSNALSGSYIWCWGYYGFADEIFGALHKYTFSTTYNSSQGLGACRETDIIVTKNNNLLYMGETRMGKAYYFKATSASATSLTVDGTDFTALGVNASNAWANKLYDFNLKKELTITSVSGTGNITLNFASQTPNPATDDEFLVFIDDKFDFGTTVKQFANNIHFFGQEDPSYWRRQIKLLGDDYFIGNGNYLASLNVDESTWAYDGKQLPYMTQFTCMGVNNDKVLIGGEYLGSTGKLMLWDGTSDGWLTILDIPNIPSAIEPYKSGWIIGMEDGSIYYSNGYEIDLLTNLPDTEISMQSSKPETFNSLRIINDRIFIATIGFFYTFRQLNGLYIYDIKTGIWSYSIPANMNGYAPTGDYSPIGAILPVSDSSGYLKIFYSGKECICYSAPGSASPNAEIWVKMEFPEKVKLSTIEINVGAKHRYYCDDAVYDNKGKVYVNITDGRNGLFHINACDTPSTTSNLQDIAYQGIVEAGMELESMSDVEAQGIGGFRTFVTAVHDSGEETENWDISPSLPAQPSQQNDFRVYHTKKIGEAVIDYRNLNSEALKFDIPDFYGDKLWLSIRFNAEGANYMDLDIHEINIY